MNRKLLDLELLAKINTHFIIRLPSHPRHAHLDHRLNLLTNYLSNDSARTGTFDPPATMRHLTPENQLIGAKGDYAPI